VVIPTSRKENFLYGEERGERLCSTKKTENNVGVEEGVRRYTARKRGNVPSKVVRYQKKKRFAGGKMTAMMRENAYDSSGGKESGITSVVKETKRQERGKIAAGGGGSSSTRKRAYGRGAKRGFWKATSAALLKRAPGESS